MPQNVDEMLAKSAATDIQVLLASKESAKRAVLDDPSPAHLAAFERASKLLEKAVSLNDHLKDWKAVLNYVEENGRKLSKSKMYNDIAAGRLKRRPDSTFSRKDVDRYMAGLPFAGTPDSLAEKVADRMRRKEEADIRKAEASAKREELELDIKLGKYIPKDQIYVELASRAVTLREAVKNVLESHAAELIATVHGDATCTGALLEYAAHLFDTCFGDYARTMDLTVDWQLEAEDL